MIRQRLFPVKDDLLSGSLTEFKESLISWLVRAMSNSIKASLA
jgi:hypothetical protein